MFKHSAESAQRRATISRASEVENTAGVDPTVWKQDPAAPLSERTAITIECQKIERQCSLLSAQIRDAQLRFHGSIPGRIVPLETVERWKREKHRLSSELKDRQIRLATMKVEKVLRHKEEDKTFERAFMEMAKEMLADEVYRRILKAAVHR